MARWEQKVCRSTCEPMLRSPARLQPKRSADAPLRLLESAPPVGFELPALVAPPKLAATPAEAPLLLPPLPVGRMVSSARPKGQPGTNQRYVTTKCHGCSPRVLRRHL